MKNITTYTFGCRANQYQSYALECLMTNAQCRMDDVILINTCTVTLDAERKSKQAIRKAIREGKRVFIAGCLARLKKKELEQAFPEAEFIDFSFDMGIKPEKVETRENLMVEDGCENFCAYCIVPFARGIIKTKSRDKIMSEAKCLVDAGAREIVLTGINLGEFGSHPLCSVLQTLSSIPNLLRIRLSSIEPMYVTDELIGEIANNPKTCKHFHIPLQTGDDELLKRMNRKYSTAEYAGVVDRIRNKIPDCGITTDIIVGLPGETDQAFKNTLSFSEKIGFSRIHTFPYSRREGTAAANIGDQVDPRIIKERFKELDKLRLGLMRKFTEKYIEKEVEVLVENKGRGLTSNFIRLIFKDDQDSTGKLHKIVLREDNIVYD